MGLNASEVADWSYQVHRLADDPQFFDGFKCCLLLLRWFLLQSWHILLDAGMAQHGLSNKKKKIQVWLLDQAHSAYLDVISKVKRQEHGELLVVCFKFVQMFNFGLLRPPFSVCVYIYRFKCSIIFAYFCSIMIQWPIFLCVDMVPQICGEHLQWSGSPSRCPGMFERSLVLYIYICV